jgi:hypothetical protein
MIDSPAARLNEPVARRIKTVDQKQENRPNEEVAEQEQQHGHRKMALGQTSDSGAGTNRQLVYSW